MNPKVYCAEAGDIFCCWGTDWVSRGISLPTSSLFGPSGVRWAPSHVAIAGTRFHPRCDSCWWWESTTLTTRPCLESKERVSGVQVHAIADRVDDYLRAGGRVQVYRLTRFDTLGGKEVHDLRNFLCDCLNDEDLQKPLGYDLEGAVLSGTKILRTLLPWRNQMETLFCSEMVAAALQRLNRLCRCNPASYSPGRLMRKLITQGTYKLHAEFRQ